MIALVVTAAGADTKIIQQVHTDGMMGQPPTEATNTIWITKDKMRTDSGDTSVVVRLDTMKLYLLDHGQKVYNTINLPPNIAKLLPAEMQQMMSSMQLTITVTPSDETKEIQGLKVRRFDVAMSNSMMQLKQTVWACKDAGFDYVSGRDAYAAMQSMQPGMGKGAFDELKKVDGFQLEMEGTITMMGNNIGMSQKTVSIDDQIAPLGTYEPPSDYTEQPFDPMAHMRR